MPWGKYKGDYIADVPSSYLVWLLDNGKVSGDTLLLRFLAAEMIRRMAELCPEATNADGSVGDSGVHDDERRYEAPRDPGPRPTPPSAPRRGSTPRVDIVLSIIESGYRAAAHKLHPDRPGGSEEKMKELNSVRDALRNIAGRV